MRRQRPAAVRRAIAAVDASLQRQRIAGDGQILVAFSGGADSASLLWLLGELPRGRRPSFRAIHVDHGLRPGSAEDAAAAQRLAEARGVPCKVLRVECSGPGGLEAAARRARYQALAAEASAAGGLPVLTAHTADDQAETVLYRLAKGAGLRGTGGIRERVRLCGATFLRPMLEVRREEVEAVVRFAELEVVEDPTNLGADFVRNRLRNEILPLLEEVIPGAAAGLARAARLATEDDAFLEQRTREARERITRGSGVEAAGLLALEPSLARRIVRELVVEAGAPLPAEAQVQRVLRVAAQGGEVHLAGQVVARARRGHLVVVPSPRGQKSDRGHGEGDVGVLG